MKRLFLMLLLLPLTGVYEAAAWGAKGHDVVAYIAECNLTPKARKALARVLGGHSLVYDASYPDFVRSNPAYNGTSTWHYANVDEGYTYASMPKNPDGDVLTASEFLAGELRNKELDDSLRKAYTVMLIHFIGDMHCPMHAGHKSDLGGNRWPVKWFGEPANLHGVWDSKLIESYRHWSYSEWREQLDRHTKREKAAIAGDGTMLDWLLETVELSKAIYAATPVDYNFSFDDTIKYTTEMIEPQLLKAGYRLAKLLNEIYG